MVVGKHGVVHADAFSSGHTVAETDHDRCVPVIFVPCLDIVKLVAVDAETRFHIEIGG